MKPIVLFVDDEPNVLRALRRMMRKQNDVWDMRFAESGAEALDILVNTPAKAVVSDMRMPGMDGAELLDVVSEAMPETVRIVLSGEADRTLTLRTIGKSHRFLPKPCSAETLIAAIDIPLQLRTELDLAGVDDLDSVWTPKEIHDVLANELHAENLNLDAIIRLIENDPALSMQVLQLANSAYFGPAISTVSVDEAVRHLGADLLRSLLDNQRLTRVGPPSRVNPDLPQPTSELAKECRQAMSELDGDPTLIDAAYTSGLLWAVAGQIAHAKGEPCPTQQAQTAAYLASLLSLPIEMVVALRTLHPEHDAEISGDPAHHIAAGLKDAMMRDHNPMSMH
ncbi:response regulator [Woodsholea maritima]|uniref:response regulator n=1 Tax=Woodsholea maritima TaxID=240237 RepID=UPI0003788896|nr:response regulator [Woodsholea maritima]